MSQTLPPRTICLRIRQLTGPPHSHEHESYELSLTVTTAGDQIFVVTHDLTYHPPTTYRTNSTNRFPYHTLSPGDNMDFVFSRVNPPPALELARLSIPLEWFPPDCQVAEAFHMDLLVTPSITPILFLDVHHNLTSPTQRWKAPYGVISPRQQPVAFSLGSGSLEFLGSVTFRPLAFSDQFPTISIPPAPLKIEAKPITQTIVADFGSRVLEWVQTPGPFEAITEIEVKESEDDVRLKITDEVPLDDVDFTEQNVLFWPRVPQFSFFPTTEDHTGAPPLSVIVDF